MTPNGAPLSTAATAPANGYQLGWQAAGLLGLRALATAGGVAGPNTGFPIGTPIGLLSWPSTRRMLELGTGWRDNEQLSLRRARRRRLLEPGSMPPAATDMRKSGADGGRLS